MKKTIYSLEKALKIMEYLSVHHNARIQDISADLEMNKTTVHTILTTLEMHHYVEKDEFKPRYSLGVKLFQLGQVYNKNFTFHYPIHETLKKLCEISNETAFFTLQVGSQYLYLDKYECCKNLRISPQIGLLEDINSNTAIGKIYQSHLDNRPICYSIDYEEVEQGLHCIAFGLYKNGVLLGVIGVAGNSTSLTREKIQTVIQTWSEYDICATNKT